jgi:hypothetical protein
MKKWNDTGKCEYPACDSDDVIPVYILWEGNEIEAWYRSPKMDDFWFESDTGDLLDGVTMWQER